MSSGWVRVSKAKPCEICGRGDWCLISGDGSAVICPRVSEGAVKLCGDAGWLHRLRETDEGLTTRYRRHVRVQARPNSAFPMDQLARRCHEAVGQARFDQFSRQLGISETSLQRLWVGWSADHQAWSFPMMDEKYRVIGIRLRRPDGRKFAVCGGREGLFVPSRLPESGQILICEGPTDTAAMLDLGFASVGRPSCRGGARPLKSLVFGRNVVVVADNDAPGRSGAAHVARTLRLYCPAVRVMHPPTGINDVRAWKRSGATQADVEAAIEAATPGGVSIRCRRVSTNHR
jgi:hypothetical protein